MNDFDRTPRTLLLVFAFTLITVAWALPAAGAVPSEFTGDLTSSDLRVIGPRVVEAPLVAFNQQLSADTVGDDAAPPRFVMQAEDLRMETDYTQTVLRVGGSALRVRDDFGLLESGTTVDTYKNVLIEGIENHADYRLMVMPIPGQDPPTVRTVSSCTAVEPSDHESINRNPRAYPRAIFSWDLATSLRWSACGESHQLTITGDFTLVIWSWSALLTAGDDTVVLQNGYDQHPMMPGGTPDLTGMVASAREHYLHASNAELTLTPQLVGSELYVGATQIRTESGARVHLHAATGFITNGFEGATVIREDVELHGEVEILVEGRGQLSDFDAHVTGHPHSAMVGGTLLDWVTPVQAPEEAMVSLALLAWIAGILGVAAVGGLVYAWPDIQHRRLENRGEDALYGLPAATRKQKRAAVYSVWAQRAKSRDHNQQFAWWARAAVRLEPSFMDYQMQRALSLRRLGLSKKARIIHEALAKNLEDPSGRAMNAAFAAVTCLETGDLEEARRWTYVAAKEDKDTFENLVPNSAFDALRGQSWFPAWCLSAGLDAVVYQ